MPSFLIPRKSGVHRAACFALCRALLRQVKQLPLAIAQQKTVIDQIRTVIRRNSKLQSPIQVSTALDLGYETLQALGSQTAWQSILIRILELGAQRSTAHGQVSCELQGQSESHKQIKWGPNGANQRVWPYPGASKTLDRPFTTLSGRRRVPKLVNANRVPLLRLKKPQSPFVSRIIRDTINTREKRITLALQLDEQLPIARHEDEWDKILSHQFGLQEEHPWSYAIRQALRENANLQVAATQKRTDLAARMQAIVQQEKALAIEEQLKVRNEKHKRKKARRLVRQEEHMPEIEQSMDLEQTKSAEQEPKITGKDPKEKLPNQIVPPDTVPGLIVRDKETFQTKEEIERVRTASAMPKTEEEIAAIKAARAKRKEEEAQRKAEKVRRKIESVHYWQQKLGTQPNHAVSAPVRLPPPRLLKRKVSHGVKPGYRSQPKGIPLPRQTPLRFHNQSQIEYPAHRAEANHH